MIAVFPTKQDLHDVQKDFTVRVPALLLALEKEKNLPFVLHTITKSYTQKLTSAICLRFEDVISSRASYLLP